MKKQGVRNIAVMLALVNLLSVTPKDAKANDGHVHYILDKNGKPKMVDDINILLNHGKTFINGWEQISAFNHDNIYSEQFGANQNVFYENFPELIKEVLIWAEMQKYFPVSRFPSYEYAMDFYNFYFKKIAASGCGYATLVDRVFQEYEGKEKEFEKTFGFPMYTINEDNSINFNYEVMILKLFNFAALYPNYNEAAIKRIMEMNERVLYNRELTRYMATEEYKIRRKTWAEVREMPIEEQLEYIDKIQKRDEKEEQLRQKAENGKYFTLSFGMNSENDYCYFEEFMKSFGVPTTVSLRPVENRDYHPGEIILGYKYDLYKEADGKKYSMQDDITSHTVYVVKNEDGKVTVSTWGSSYYFDDNGATWVYKLETDIKVKDNVKGR